MLGELCERVSRARALSATKERHVDKFTRNPSKEITSIVKEGFEWSTISFNRVYDKRRRRMERWMTTVSPPKTWGLKPIGDLLMPRSAVGHVL
jgi:alkaline phosphatase